MLIDGSLPACSLRRRDAAEGPWKAVAAWSHVVLEKTTHDDWKARAEAFDQLKLEANALAAAFRAGRDAPAPPPESVARAGDVGLRDQHGAVTKACSGAVVALAAAVGAAADAGGRDAQRGARDVAQELLQSSLDALAFNKGKVMAAYSFEAARALVTAVSARKLLPVCAAPAMAGRGSGAFREACLGLVIVYLTARDTIDDADAELAAGVVQVASGDSAAGVRGAARRVYWALKRRRPDLAVVVDARTRKLLDKGPDADATRYFEEADAERASRDRSVAPAAGGAAMAPRPPAELPPARPPKRRGVRAPTLMRKVSVEDVAAADIQKLARGKSTRSTPRGTPDAPPWPASPRPCAACGALVRDRDAAREELAAARAVWAAEKAALVAALRKASAALARSPTKSPAPRRSRPSFDDDGAGLPQIDARGPTPSKLRALRARKLGRSPASSPTREAS